ncbi:unnamed protein product [Rotaria sp. Silwood2]|nr:unnamed protein product [Rotaria sp. Silwood2]
MADEFIRQLTHDSNQFEKEWANIASRLDQLFRQCETENVDVEIFKVKALDAVVDYILAEPNPTVEQSCIKVIFVEAVIKHCASEPLPSLAEIVRIVRRILDCEMIFNQWYLSSIEAFHFKFQLCLCLTSTQSYNLIESLLQSLKKHTFLNDQSDKATEEKWQHYISRRIFSPLSCDSNKLNDETTMLAIRPIFQQIFRHAAHLSHQSRVWASIIYVFTRTLPTLFDSYVNIDDAQIDFSLCVEEPISTDYILFISKSYNRNPHLIKNNFSQALLVIERLLLGHHIREVRYFIDEAILAHMETVVDIEALVQMFVRVCPLIPINHRKESCKEVISNITYKLGRMKCSKKLAPLFFDFALILLDLCVLEAPQCAVYLLEKNDFYPWKDLAPRFTDLLRLCSTYDTIVVEKTSSELNSLVTILRLAVDRAKAHAIIYRSTHKEALRAISRWTYTTDSDNNNNNNNNTHKIWSNHVYNMGQPMLDLIDQRQMTIDICTQLIEVLRLRIVDNESGEDDIPINYTMNSFFINIAAQLANYIDLLKVLSHDAHSRLATLVFITLSRPLRYENGQMSMEFTIAERLWHRLCSYLTYEADVRLYEPCIQRIHSLACDEDETIFFQWWSTFWCHITMKVPDVAANYVDDFFRDVFEHKQIVITSLLPMLYSKRPETYHARLNDIIDALHSSDVNSSCWLAQVFVNIAQERPQLITSTQVERVFAIIQSRTNSSHDLYYLFQGLGSVANVEPLLFDPYRTIILRFVVEFQSVSAMKCLQQYFVAATLLTSLVVQVDAVDNRVNDVSEQVAAQAREIERIDAKTLSHVPVGWGREVCKLLNRRANNDWRLLGKRFGYSTSELRHWALQVDPTMALLNEWFMTHKTDEATYGLVKMLDEICREDVAKIIRDAVATMGDLIPDDMPFEIKRLPPVFLSYQWGAQQAVLNLKNHLEEAGYACWMDTSQMGGGDKLFTKIDAGIRGAKVVVCCMNAAYAQSENCSREVHLAVSTGKPLIPLQMEKQKWPPEGALGPIMSEYLFIRFFDRKGNDPNFWPVDKFNELLGQIRYHVAPDLDMITDRYRNWFVPRVDNLIFLQPTTNTDNNQATKKEQVTDDTPLVITHPQVMISYQWDRQSDIVALYKRLTQLGYRCWLDIFQMGGGDSLFEKIDAGIRHAKCVLACVTPKYTLSINCRREMSLANALKKTIAPLYLEETSTWPPPGPMAMIFSDKPFIDFRRPNGMSADADVWTSKEFEKVLGLLRDAVPEVHTEKPQRYLLEMKRPTTATAKCEVADKRLVRVKSAPVNPQSRACSIM